MPKEDDHGLVIFLEGIIGILDRVRPFVRWIHMVAAGLLFLAACLVFADVIARYVFNRPIPNSMDFCAFLLVFILFLAVAYPQLDGRHISVDVITSRLSPGAAMAVDTATSLLSIGTAGVLAWRGVIAVISFAKMGLMTSGVVEVSLAPLAALIPFGCAILFLMLLRDFLNKIVEAVRLHLGGRMWLLISGVPLVIIALLVLWMLQVLGAGISPPLVGGIAVLTFFVFIYFGMPIAFVLAMTGIVFVGHLTGLEAGLSVAGRSLYYHIANYNWFVIPLFILMGYIVTTSKLGTDAYNTAYKWVGHYRGGLATATVGGSAALAAVLGDPLASTITLGAVALPEMKKYKYADSLSCGVIAAGATLAPMIPPSIGFIIYGVLAEESIGRLFIAGIIPGIMLALGFVLVVFISCRLNPRLGPPGERSGWGPRMSSLKSGGPILLLFLIVIGGIYAGVFTAIEGGGIGAFMAFVIALAMRRLPWKTFVESIVEGGKFVALILFMVVGASMFGHVLAASNLTTELSEILKEMAVPPLAVVGFVLLIFLVLGTVMDAPIVLILTTPILAPIASALGIDLIWFGVLVVLMTNLGLITPPYAMIIFVLRGIADVPITVVYRGVIWFVIVSLVVCILIIFFPFLATWLPYHLM